MAEWSAERFRNVAVVSLVVAILMVAAMEWLQHASLSLWLHIPLTILVLTGIGGGAAVAGAAYMEYQARSAGSGQKAQES